MRGCGDEQVALRAKVLHRLFGGRKRGWRCAHRFKPPFRAAWMAKTVDRKPLFRAQAHIGVEAIGVPVFGDINILQAERIAGAQHGACVLWLINVFQKNRNVAGAMAQHCGHFLPPRFGNEAAEKRKQRLAILFGERLLVLGFAHRRKCNAPLRKRTKRDLHPAA